MPSACGFAPSPRTDLFRQRLRFFIAAPAPSGNDIAVMPRTALIVEDEKELAELLATILRMRHFEPAVLYSGAPAAQWVREHSPGLILLDLMLPDRDGYTV